MRIFSLMMVVLLGFGVARPAGAAQREPPFRMASYDEFSDWDDEQKKFYLKELSEQIVEIPSLNLLKQANLEEASVWAEGWDVIESKLNRACDDNKDLTDICDDIAEIRQETFALRGRP
ncbi:MAG: hypothetical protein KF865_05500 [Bdellovibrionaceae bacterium]|nr:hypothetical protein [Pseudobdellovibrionaceae bacterium]